MFSLQKHYCFSSKGQQKDAWCSHNSQEAILREIAEEPCWELTGTIEKRKKKVFWGKPHTPSSTEPLIKLLLTLRGLLPQKTVHA